MTLAVEAEQLVKHSLVLHDFAWPAIGRSFAVVTLLGVVMVALSISSIRRYD